MDMFYFHSLKLIHILSSTLLLGTGLGSVFYLWRANQSGNISALATTIKNVVIADWVFTTPAIIIQPITGLLMADFLRIPLATPWLLRSLGLYLLIGLCWLPVVFIQIKMAKIATKAHSTQSPLPPAYYQLIRYWYALGVPAFFAMLAIFYFMVFKPY
jgi:uncharacterized membrane protein